MSRTSERRARRAVAQRQNQTTGLLQNRKFWITGGVVLAVIVFGVLACTILNQSTPTTTSGTPGATTAALLTPVAVGIEVSVPSMGAGHVNPGEPHATYNSTPPTSGPHYGAPNGPANWSKYDNPLPEEVWLHNLEHGGIGALFNCPQGCVDLVSKLEALRKDRSVFSRYGNLKMVTAPYSKIPNRLTLVAWNYYLPLADYDEAAVRKFIIAHQDKGPEDVP